MRNRFPVNRKSHRNRARESGWLAGVEVPAGRLGNVFGATHSDHLYICMAINVATTVTSFHPGPCDYLFFFLRGSIAAFLVGICCRSLRFVLSIVYLLLSGVIKRFLSAGKWVFIVWKVDVCTIGQCIYCHSMNDSASTLLAIDSPSIREC
jgi:hypothetical protein